MVGITIGLVTVLVVTQVMAVSETRRKAASSGSDTLVNATLGLYTIERDGKNAGYGMTTVASSIGCEVRGTYSGTPHNFDMAPVTITDSAGGAPDKIKFMASDKNGVTLPVRIAVDHPQTAANFFVESDLGIEDGDLMIAVPAVLNTASPATTWCSVFAVTGTGGGGGGGGGGNGNGNGGGGGQGQNQVLHTHGGSPWNPSGGSNIFPNGGYHIGDYVVNLGNFIEHTYSIDTSNMLALTEFNMKTGTDTTKQLYPNIVQLQAVYGKDTNADGIVDAWNATAPTTAAEWQQIRAIRVALVARGQVQEGAVTLDGANAASTCASATPHPAAVCWKPDPNGNGVKIDVSAGTTNWQNYRYRVVETTIPFRNAIWKQ